MKELRAFAEMIDAPVAVTLLGIGGFPASHPLSIGMMGMHGEAWVNHAIQEADLLLAFGMRFDDRVTGNLKTYAPHAKKIHIDIDPSEINKNVRADAAIVADLRETLRDMLDMLEPSSHGPWLKYIASMKGDTAVRDIQRAAGQRSPLRGARDQRHLAPHQRQRHHCDRRRPASDVGGAVLPPQRSADAHHLRRPRDDGVRPAGGDRRQVRQA